MVFIVNYCAACEMLLFNASVVSVMDTQIQFALSDQKCH